MHYCMLHEIVLRTDLSSSASGKEPTCQCRRCKRQETWVRSLSREDPLEEGMATHSSILVWRTPWIEEPEGYSPWGHKQSDMSEVT